MHFSTILTYIGEYRYIALLILAIVEGPIVALVAGFLVHIGTFTLLPTCLILLLGDLPDSICYLVGRYSAKRRNAKKNPRLAKLQDWAEKLWEKHPTKAMFISKLAYGLSLPLLITAGMSKMSYKAFIWRALVVTAFQYGVLMTVGYLLGNVYTAAAPYIKDVQIGIAVLAILALGAFFFVQYRVRHFVEKHESN